MAYDMFMDKGTEKQKHEGMIEFYEEDVLVQRFTFKELRGLRVAVIPKSYGVDLITDLGTYAVTRWVVRKDKAA